MADPKVSVIIPTHNRATLLPRAVKSVLSQSFTDFELLIVDDGSSDETSTVLAGFTDPRIRICRHSQSRGSSASRNTGIANAVGEYLAFLDDDDEYLPTKIEEQVLVLDEAGADVGMVYVWSDYVGPTGERLGSLCRTERGDVFADVLMLRLTVGGGSTVMIRASALDSVGAFDETILRCEDIDLMCRLTRQYKIAYIPKILTRLHIGHARKSAPSRKSVTEWRDYILVHQENFRGEIARRRRVRASIWRTLALTELRVRNHIGAIRAIVIATLTDPTTVYYVGKWLVKKALGRVIAEPWGR